jgi:hypothetical protein
MHAVCMEINKRRVGFLVIGKKRKKKKREKSWVCLFSDVSSNKKVK